MTPRSRIWFLRLPNKSRCGEFWHRDSLTIAPESFRPSHRSAIDGRKDEERMVGEHPSQLAIGNFLRRAITFALARAAGNTSLHMVHCRYLSPSRELTGVRM